MKICLIWIEIVCGLFSVFPVDIKGNTCKCSNWSGGECKSCDVGCYGVSNYLCHECHKNCYSCSSKNACDICKTGLYGPRCDYDCVSCRNAACTDKTCTDGCADGYYYHEGDGGCRRCQNTCVTCNSISDCTSCITGHTGSYCQHCITGNYLKNEQCNQCNTNCLRDTCFDDTGECTDGCKDGWTGVTCIGACGPNCASCYRHNETACTSCKPGYYGPSCNNVCHWLSGKCLIDCSQPLCSKDGENQDTQTSDFVSFIGGAVGFAVMIILINAAVWVFISRRKRRRNEADPERRVAYENCPLDNGPITITGTVTDTDTITESTGTNNVSVKDTDTITESTGPGNVNVTDTDTMTESTVRNTTYTQSLGQVINREDHCTALIPSIGPVYEELDKNDDVGDAKAHYTALIPSQGPVYEELNKNDDVDDGDIKDYEVPTTSNYYNI